MCFPLPSLALFGKEATGPDTLKHAGCLLLPIPLPFEEHRVRVPGTNNFYKADDPGNIDMHSSPGCVNNGPSCSTKLC